MKKRDETVDLLKGFAIFLVLWGHSIQCCGGGSMFLDTTIAKIIYLVHMPLFMWLAGYVAKNAIQRPWPIFIKDKMRQLMLPMAIWCLVAWIAKILLNELIITDIPFAVVSLIKTILGSYWFVWTLIFCFFIFKITPPNYVLLTLILVLLFPVKIPYLGVDSIKYLFPFFVFGYICGENGRFKRIVNSSPYLFVISLLIYVCLLFVVERETFIYYLDLSIKNPHIIHDYFNLVLLYMGGICGIIVLYCLAGRISSSNSLAVKHVKAIGKYTLAIYLIQGIICLALSSADLHLNNHIYYILTAILFLEICYLFILLVANKKTLSKYLMGK